MFKQASLSRSARSSPREPRLTWSFDAAAPMDFNIHYHEGKEVRFPAKKSKVVKDAGTLLPKP